MLINRFFQQQQQAAAGAVPGAPAPPGAAPALPANINLNRVVINIDGQTQRLINLVR